MRLPINQHDEGRNEGSTPLRSLLANNATDEEGGAIMRPPINQNNDGRRQYYPTEPTNQKHDPAYQP